MSPDPPRQGPRRPPRRDGGPAVTTTPAAAGPRAGRGPRPAPAAPVDRRLDRQRRIRRNRLVAGAGVLAVVALLAWGCSSIIGGDGDGPATTSSPASSHTPDASSPATPGPAPNTGLAADPAERYDGWVDPKSSGQPWSSQVVGQLTFRGNPTRSYYGLGPVPTDPKIQWRFPPSGGMCGNSPVGGENKTWCGTGWTGEPAVWEQGGKTWVSFGAYDKAIHFLDARTGDKLLADYDIGDIVKGSVTRDPDGMPLLYTGSRADFHVLALDRAGAQPESLFTLTAGDVEPVKWNDDWDGSSLVIDDYLFEGGENGQFHILKLNRKMGPDAKVTVDPKIVFHAPGWDDRQLEDLSGSGSRVNDVSIENSVAISGNTVYFSNSGGLLQGWDITGLKDGRMPTRTFRYWTGDDTDASVVIDAKGFLYVAQERERASTFARSDEVGQLIKLDPRKPGDPVVWSVPDSRGIWTTPAIYKGVVYAPTDGGRLIAVDQNSGKVLWEKKLPGPTWQSPVVVDDTLIQGDCLGNLRAYDVSRPGVDPPELWSVKLEGCIESTPTVFQGQIFVGARGGAFYALGDA